MPPAYRQPLQEKVLRTGLTVGRSEAMNSDALIEVPVSLLSAHHSPALSPTPCGPATVPCPVSAPPSNATLQDAMAKFSFGSETSEAERAQLKSLLLEYPEVISIDDYDLGRTHLIEHEVFTGDAAPIKRNPYLLSPAEHKKLTS